MSQAHDEAILARELSPSSVALALRSSEGSTTEWRALAPDPDDVLARAFGVAAAWPAVRRAVPCVFGARLAVRPALQQTATGAWIWRPDAIEEDANATDDLVRLALNGAATLDPAASLAVYVDGVAVGSVTAGTGRAVSFAVRPGCVVLARHGAALNRLRVPLA